MTQNNQIIIRSHADPSIMSKVSQVRPVLVYLNAVSNQPLLIFLLELFSVGSNMFFDHRVKLDRR
jgi:hypothetical protein